MANYSLPMVLKIKEVLDNFNEPDYSFDYDDDEASFIMKSDVSTTGDPVLVKITVERDEDEDDLISVLSMLNVDYDYSCEDDLEAIAAYANKNGCEQREHPCKMFVREGDEGEFNLCVLANYYFDDDICDDESEDEFTELMHDVIGGATTEFALISPLLARMTGGEEEYNKVLGRLQRQIEGVKNQLNNDENHSSPSNGIDMDELLEKFIELKERAEAGDVDAQIEMGKSLQTLNSGEIPDKDADDDMKPTYWFEKAAKQGSCEAYYQLALCYHEGNSVQKNLNTAKNWYDEIIDSSLYCKSKNSELVKASLRALDLIRKERGDLSEVVFPVTYSKSTFESMDEVIEQFDTNPDAMGFYSQCSVFGAGVIKRGTLAIDGLFAAANAGSVDAIVGLGRMYECGYDFLARNVDCATTLYKYAYSLKSADALHSLGCVLFNTLGKKDIGLSMMKKAAELGCKGANTQLELIKDKTDKVPVILFSEIPKKEFEYDEVALADSLQLYAIDLNDVDAVKNAILDIMTNMKPETFSIIMNEFRVKYLRRRKLMHFSKEVNFREAFDALVKEGLVETRGVEDYGIAENTLYIAKASTQKMKSVTLDWDI